MSLVYFHIFLMSTAIVFAFAFGIWETENYSSAKKIFDLIMAVFSFIFSIGLSVYLAWFIKKKKPFMK